MPELVHSVLDVFPIDWGMPKLLATSQWENIHHVKTIRDLIFLTAMEATDETVGLGRVLENIHISGQIIATSPDLTPKGSLGRDIPLFQ